MDIDVKAGATPKDPNPGNPNPAGGNTPPGNDGGNSPADNGGTNPQYESFFQEKMQQAQTRRGEIAENLKDSKLTEADRLRLEREDFELEKEMARHGFKKPDVVSTVDLSFVTNPQQKAYLENVLRDVPPDEVKAILEYTKQLIAASGQPLPTPADIGGQKEGERTSQTEKMGFSLKDMWGVGKEKHDSKAVGEAVFGFLSGLKDNG